MRLSFVESERRLGGQNGEARHTPMLGRTATMRPERLELLRASHLANGRETRMRTISRRGFIILGGGAAAGFAFLRSTGSDRVLAVAVPGGTLDPTTIPKYAQPLAILPAMPRTTKLPQNADKNMEYYEIGLRQFMQQILPPGSPKTKVWGYGSLTDASSFRYPACTIEAKSRKAVRIRWINQLVDSNGHYLPHLLPVDQTLHWANPPGGPGGTDSMGTAQARYTGPVPMITHLHGGHSPEEADGHPQAWYLPNASNLPGGYAAAGSFYAPFKSKAEQALKQTW